MYLNKTIPVALLCILLFVNCSSMPENSAPPEKPLTGMVYDSEGRPVQGARILVDNNDAAVTDLNGRFVTVPISPGSHILDLSKTGFENERVTVDFTSPLEILYMQVISFDSLMADAEELLDRENPEEALILLKRAAAINPENPALIVLTYTAAFHAGNTELANQYAPKLEKLNL